MAVIGNKPRIAAKRIFSEQACGSFLKSRQAGGFADSLSGLFRIFKAADDVLEHFAHTPQNDVARVTHQLLKKIRMIKSRRILRLHSRSSR